MAKTLIAFYSHAGENYVDGSVRFLKRGNNEIIVDKIKTALPKATIGKGLAIQGSKVSTSMSQIEKFVTGGK